MIWGGRWEGDSKKKKEEVKLSLFADDTTLMAQRKEELKSFLMK